MKKQLFLGLAVASSVFAVAQQKNKMLPNATAVKVNLNKYSKSTYEPAFTTPSKKNGPVNSTLAAPYKRIGGSPNNLGSIVSESRCLQYNADIKTVGLAYRQDATWAGIPMYNTGTISYAWSSNNGLSWDSTVMAANDTKFHRYPAGSMYNPALNTNPANAYAIVCGPWHPGANWQGSYFSNKQLTAPGSNSNTNVSYVDNLALTTGQTKQDFTRISPQTTSDGVFHIVGELVGDINATTAPAQAWRGITLNKAVFNSGTFNWTIDSIIPSFKLSTNGDKNGFQTPNVSWSENGQIGYVVFYAVDANAQAGTSQNSFQPFVYKSIDAGVTWTRFAPLFDFTTIASINDRLFPVRGSTVTALAKPFISPGEGGSTTVDAAGNLHVLANLNSSFSDNLDSLGFTYSSNFNQVWTYIVDYKTTATGWDAIVLDSLSCEGVIATTSNWTGASNLYDARLQISRTADGKQIFYSWADSDSLLVTAHASTLPDIYQMGYDVILNKFTCKKNMTVGKVGAEKQAYFHYTAPIVATPTASLFLIPTMFVRSDDGTLNGDIAVSHYYLDDNTFSASEFTVVPNTIGCVAATGAGINEASSSISDLSFYPNPTANDGTVSLTINENAKVKISVLNAVGQVVYTTTMVANAGNNKLDVNLSQLSSGLYFYQVQVANKKAVTKKFVIEK